MYGTGTVNSPEYKLLAKTWARLPPMSRIRRSTIRCLVHTSATTESTIHITVSPRPVVPDVGRKIAMRKPLRKDGLGCQKRSKEAREARRIYKYMDM